MNASSMTWNEFLTEAKQFLGISQKLKDSWEFYEKDKHEGNSYLVYKQKISIAFDNAIKELDAIDCQKTVDEAIPSSSTTTDIVQLEYHVLYSISYQVPVFYFKGHRSDGRPLGLEDAWCIFKTYFSHTEKSRADLLSILTQVDHPILFKPFLSLHPCRSAEILGQAGISRNRIVTFVSVMGPYIQLHLNNEYGLAEYH